jgi:hypothetical protein
VIGTLIAVDIVSLELDLGPDPRVLAISEFHEAPGPGVALVDLNGEGMVYTESVWMDDSGHVTAGGWGMSGTGLSVSHGAASVTGRASSQTQLVVQVQHSKTGEAFEFVVSPSAEGWYAGCRPLPGHWHDLDSVTVQVSDHL